VLAKKLPKFLEHNPGMMASVRSRRATCTTPPTESRFCSTPVSVLIIKPRRHAAVVARGVAELERQYERVADDYPAHAPATTVPN
jgi:hypothetical protein